MARAFPSSDPETSHGILHLRWIILILLSKKFIAPTEKTQQHSLNVYTMQK